jgi:putative ABC transport system permease protein
MHGALRVCQSSRLGVPGVESGAVARDFPLSVTDPSTPILTEGRSPAPVQGEILTRYRAVGDGYFGTLRIPLLKGRGFDGRDTASSPPVAIVSESLARKYWPGENAVGKRLKPDIAGSSSCLVVGVAADVRHWGADMVIEPTAYYPYAQVPESIRSLVEANMGIAIRNCLAQSELLDSINAAVVAVNQNVPVYDVKTMDSMLSDSGSLRNFDFWLLGAFSLLALSSAAVGVYAVMAFSVSRRTRGSGFASRSERIRAMSCPSFSGRAHGWRLPDRSLGVVRAFFLRKITASFLFGPSAKDPLVLSIVPCIMVLVILLAYSLPARRATKIDPMVPLRYE